ncbi:MAG: hypothetical protein ACI4PW_07105 [Alphaproteobacteria bacterium]|jgi:cysteinyl-tRNA synthetase
MGKAFYFFAAALFLAAFSPLKAQEFQGVRANMDDPLDEQILLDPQYIPNYRELMRDIVAAFSEYVKNTRPDFYIVAAGGHDLLTRGEWENDLDELHRAEAAGAKSDDERFLLKLFSPEEPIAPGTPNRRYIQSINAFLTDNQICGSAPLPKKTLGILRKYGVSVLDVEHCRTAAKMREAQTVLAERKIPAHADTDKAARFDYLDPETKPFLENPDNVASLNDVRNILIMTDTRNYASKGEWVNALTQTNYDLLIIDPFYKYNQPLTKEDIRRLRYKKLGARRLVFAVLDISSAEDTRMYWEPSWKLKSPAWLRFPSKTRPGAIVVDYWSAPWKGIIGNYFKSIMDLGYDGIVLQGLDAHKTYEKIIPIN